MPKSKKHLEVTRTRRQASKEALKQMQLLLGDDDEDTFVIEDDDDDKTVRLEKKRAVSPIIEPPPKKKYKLSHRKSSDGNDRDVIVLKSISHSNYVPKEETLELECTVEELSEVQMDRRKQLEQEEIELEEKLKELLNGRDAEVVFKGNYNTAVEFNELISNGGKNAIFQPNQSPDLEANESTEPEYQLVMDPRLGIIVGTVQKAQSSQVPIRSKPPVTKGKITIASAVKAVATLTPSQSSSPSSSSSSATKNTRTRRGALVTPTRTNNSRSNSATPVKLNATSSAKGNVTRGNTVAAGRGATQIASQVTPTIKTRGMKITTPTLQTRTSKTPLTASTKRPVGETKEVVDLTSDEIRSSQVDNREISFNKLQGKTYPSLVVVARPHLRVVDLGAGRSKLDSKVKSVLMHPPAKFTEWLIQQGLIRSEQKCPVHTNTQLKLGMYSDAAKFPFSGGYVWISECCPQRFISVFNGSFFEGSPHPPMVMLKLIYHWSCQTNIQNVTQWVKVDNLYVKGVYTWLRGICTLGIQNRARQLGGPGCKIEVGVISLGTTSHDGNQRQVKVEVLGILESSTKNMRLRAVEPLPEGERNFRKKFSKILEPILLWVNPASTIVTDMTVDKNTLYSMGFMNVIQTTANDYVNSNRTIMEYLRRIVPRMFQNTLSLLSRQIIQQFLDELVWREWFGITAQHAFDNIISHLAEQTRVNTQPSLILKLNKVAANPFRTWSNNATLTPAISSTSATVSSQPSITTKTPVSEVKRQGRGRKSNSPQVPSFQERPTKPVSPDVPEQMVPLEKYYYGTIDLMTQARPRVTLNLKCPFCKSVFDNNLQLQNHLFKHAHNVSIDAYLCRYCLTSVSTANELLYHVNKFHPGETKFDNGFVCLICESHYVNPFVLGKHMSKEHSPHELPYQCGSCTFRCSNHKQIIDHFYVRHDGGTTIQCPFCLKSTTIWSGGRNVTQNVHYFIQHLQKHQKKQLAKRCGKCNLWFIQKDILKEHQQNMHISLRGRLGLVPAVSPRNGVMVPKSKIDKNPCNAEIINFASLSINIPNGSLCKECGESMESSKHFPSFDTCQNPNCQFSTCCATAMMTHNVACKGLNSEIPSEQLPYEMFCICGHKDKDGNSMAKHLAICEKKSAYPSKADAKSATVMHSMLDILGLVRKPEETPPSKTKEKKGSKKDKTPSDKEMIESAATEVSILSDDEDSSQKVSKEGEKIEETIELIEDESDGVVEKTQEEETENTERMEEDETKIEENTEKEVEEKSEADEKHEPENVGIETNDSDEQQNDNTKDKNDDEDDTTEKSEQTTNEHEDDADTEIDGKNDETENKEVNEIESTQNEDDKIEDSENETDKIPETNPEKCVIDFVKETGCELESEVEKGTIDSETEKRNIIESDISSCFNTVEQADEIINRSSEKSLDLEVGNDGLSKDGIEAALNDIFSSTSNDVTPMDVDLQLETELSEITGVSMDVD